MSKHTPGPWFHDCNGSIWRRNPDELYQNGGTVAGDRPLATVSKGWHHEGAEGYPVEANARLIAAAPELLEALSHMVGRIAYYAELKAEGIPNIEDWAYTYNSGDMQRARAAIAKAEGSE